MVGNPTIVALGNVSGFGTWGALVAVGRPLRAVDSTDGGVVAMCSIQCAASELPRERVMMWSLPTSELLISLRKKTSRSTGAFRSTISAASNNVEHEVPSTDLARSQRALTDCSSVCL